MNEVKFKSVYAFEVIDLIKSGKEVFSLDRLNCLTERVSKMYVDDFLNAIDDKTNRYDFWIEESEETANE